VLMTQEPGIKGVLEHTYIPTTHVVVYVHNAGARVEYFEFVYRAAAASNAPVSQQSGRPASSLVPIHTSIYLPLATDRNKRA
jgi:hypothetical protein